MANTEPDSLELTAKLQHHLVAIISHRQKEEERLYGRESQIVANHLISEVSDARILHTLGSH